MSFGRSLETSPLLCHDQREGVSLQLWADALQCKDFHWWKFSKTNSQWSEACSSPTRHKSFHIPSFSFQIHLTTRDKSSLKPMRNFVIFSIRDWVHAICGASNLVYFLQIYLALYCFVFQFLFMFFHCESGSDYVIYISIFFFIQYTSYMPSYSPHLE